MLPKEEVEFVEGFCRLSEAVQTKEVIDSNERSLLSSMSDTKIQRSGGAGGFYTCCICECFNNRDLTTSTKTRFPRLKSAATNS